MTTQNPPPSQTRSFMTIWMIELWERFGYYGMAALLVCSWCSSSVSSDERRTRLGRVHRAGLRGAGDRRLDRRQVLGTRRTMPIGAAILAIGYLMLAVPSENLYFLYALRSA